MTIAFLVILSMAGTLLILCAAGHQKAHGWGRCLKCHRWFDRQGTVTPKPPWIARFAIHGDGVCPECVESRQAPSQPGEPRSFAA